MLDSDVGVEHNVDVELNFVVGLNVGVLMCWCRTQC